jgi:hypothetical protein
MTMAIIIKGKVLKHSTPDQPAENIRVEIWAKGFSNGDDFLCSYTTSSDGEFDIKVDPDWQDDDIPEGYLRVYSNGVAVPFELTYEEGESVIRRIAGSRSHTYIIDIRVFVHDVESPTNPGGRTYNNEKALLENLRYLVAYQPTPRDTGGVGVRRASEIETVVSDALRDVLGKTVRRNDGRALQGVLDHVFKFETVEGQRRVRFQQPTYTVTTDLGTELSGPQKSLYTLIESMGREVRKRIETIRPLNIDSDSERTEPDRNGWLIELEELISTIRNSIHLRPLRLDGAFERLEQYRANVEKSFGFEESKRRKYIQSIDDEQVYTEFVNAKQFQKAMETAWDNFKTEEKLMNGESPRVAIYRPTNTPVLIGTLLAKLEELLTVAYESVEEVYSDLNALGVGEEERGVITLRFNNELFEGQEITVAEFFDWVANFSKNKAPRILKDGGRSALRILYGEVEQLANLVGSIHTAVDLPPQLLHPRVTTSIEALKRHLVAIKTLLAPVCQTSSQYSRPSSSPSETQTRTEQTAAVVHYEESSQPPDDHQGSEFGETQGG